MGISERIIFVNKLNSLLEEVQGISHSLINDYVEALDGTDENFPNKITKLNEQIIDCQHVIDSIDDLIISMSQIEPCKLLFIRIMILNVIIVEL